VSLPAEFLDELRARTPLAEIVGRRVRLARSGRQWKGCCPFHGEKTPSFYVYDDHFHCFGCGAHGDAISFVMQSQGSSFPEAVEQLAAEAGMQVPKPSPEAAEAERHRLDLHGVLEAAAGAYRRRLRLPEGGRALEYLRGRGLTDETIEGFGLGWSGDGRGALAADLSRQGITPELLVEAGLMKPPEDGSTAHDFFFGRVMFPIRDRRGRVISFGGRTLGDGQPKYVNGPETDLFSKRRTLFALDLAREAARAGAAVVVVEGYMDVIALHQAGFGGAVAPLGTALTEEQLEEIWRLSPMPVLCFDGDAAGGRAAARAAELALPHLSAERSLTIAKLPAGEDPDTLVLKRGPAAFQAVLDAKNSLADCLFDLTRENVGDATPELRASLSSRLEEIAGRIGDRALGWEYRQVLRKHFKDRYRQRTPAHARRGPDAFFKPSPAFNRPAANPAAAAAERGRNLVAILLRHPALLHDVEEAFGTVALPPALDRLRTAILQHANAAETLDSAALMTHLTSIGLAAEVAQALSVVPYPLPAAASPDAMPEEAEDDWWHIFGLIDPGRLDEEVAAAERDMKTQMNNANQHRLKVLAAARNALRRGEPDEADA
jgi:DNA primase